MTRKHFTAIAKALNFTYSNCPDHREVVTTLASALADQFESVNPRFNRSKFLAVALA